MDPRLIAQWITIAALVLLSFVGIAFIVVRREFLRWAEIVDRIPDTEWFEDVRSSLKLIGPLHAVATATKEKVERLDSDWRLDHESLLQLKTEHGILHPLVVDRRAFPRIDTTTPIPNTE